MSEQRATFTRNGSTLVPIPAPATKPPANAPVAPAVSPTPAVKPEATHASH